jgi:hypothetical protein
MSNVFAAFMLAAGAGLSTTVGAAFVFIKRFFHPKSFGLAISLGYNFIFF